MHVTAVVGFKLDLVIEAMPDISFVYNEVYDSTNTSKSLLKALHALPGGRRALDERRRGVRPAGAPLIDEHIETGHSFVCVDHASVAEEEVKYTLDDDGYIKELSKTVVGGLGEAVGINYVSADDKADADRAARRVRRPGLLRARHRAGHRAGRPAFEPVDISEFQVVEVDFDDDLTRANEFVWPTRGRVGCRSASCPSTTTGSRSAPPTR